MKTVTQLQCIFARISTLGFAMPSVVVMYYAMLAMGSVFNGRVTDPGENAPFFLGATAILLGMVGVWWIGLRLITGYHNILKGRVSPAMIGAAWRSTACQHSSARCWP
jgi:hypothetical protein